MASEELIAAGRLGVGALATDDCRATYEELKAKGVEFTEEPTERFYGIDAASGTRSATPGAAPSRSPSPKAPSRHK
ncbi:hypothetical protein NE236_25655 [Actinoallomurus purpureus]|uniref:VOC family protein n=1 Tax=Actinoallomurus purpureus TaxID=478114 RepID=UPI002092D73F|nr:VOC family protein [Actinoallomurus purpureus]MCO6008368.1 hypothetical protein [Actinoallomurus purpureus]